MQSKVEKRNEPKSFTDKGFWQAIAQIRNLNHRYLLKLSHGPGLHITCGNREITDIKYVDVPPTQMTVELATPQATLEQIITKILASRRISRLDQRLLMAASYQSALTTQEENLLKQVYELLHRGLLKVVN